MTEQSDDDRKWYSFWCDDTAGDLSKYEDMKSQRERYRLRFGSQDAIRLPCERHLPRHNKPESWAAFHQEHAKNGNFDPCSVLRRPSCGK